MAAAEPQLFFTHLHERLTGLEDLQIICANPSAPYPCFDEDRMAAHGHFNAMFLTSAVRHKQGRGVVHYVPQHLSRWTQNLLSRQRVDVFWGSCTPPDSRGIVSLGPGACYEPEILRAADAVVLEANPNLPRTIGSTLVHMREVDCFIESARLLPTIKPASLSPKDEQIAAHIAHLVADGSTIQLGIGSIPNALAKAFLTKKDLGVHTEMINDTMRVLFEAGVITGRYKSRWQDKMIGAFAFGSADLYRFIDQNSLVELHPASVVNDPYRIGLNTRMVSINTAVEIDITGQVCSESVGHVELSGVGGAADTHVGAQRSPGGRGIVALHSCGSTKESKIFSKIVFELKAGAKVSISRNDIDTVVTEHGIAELRGRSVAERARALIAIASPEFRDKLLHLATEHRYI